MKSLNILFTAFLSIVILATCEQNESIAPEVPFEPYKRKTTLDGNQQLSSLLGELGNFNTNGRFSFAETDFGTLQLDRIIETHVKESQSDPNFSIPILTEAPFVEYLVLARRPDQYYGYIIQYEYEAEFNFSNFTGTARILDLERRIQAENYFENGQEVTSKADNGRTNTTYTGCDCAWVPDTFTGEVTGEEIPTGDVILDCVCDEMFDAGDSSTGGGEGSGEGESSGGGNPPDGGNNGPGTPVGGGSSGGGGGGTGTPPDDDDTDGEEENNGDAIALSIGDKDTEFLRVETIKFLLEENPFALIDIDCGQLEKWQQVSAIEIPQSVNERLNALESQTGGLGDLLSLNDDWELQELVDGNGISVNMDEFSVNVTLPSSTSPETLLEHFRKNFLNQLNGAVFSPHPNLSGEEARWNNESTSLGSILSIDMLDDGSVICIEKNSMSWTLTTIEDPYNYTHPVSGNRQFGFESNNDGTYNFYTRGVDRMTNFIEASVRDVAKFKTDMDMLDLANPVWESFQELIADYTQSIGGSATINTPIINRPNYEKLSEFLAGEITTDQLENCN